MGVVVEAAPATPAAHIRQVAIVSCDSLTRGGPQLRCAETARTLTAHGLPSRCYGPAHAVGIGESSCFGSHWQAILEPVLSLRTNALAIIFLRTLPPLELLEKVRHATCAPVLLDTMDAGLGATCTFAWDRTADTAAETWQLASVAVPRLSAPCSMIPHVHLRPHCTSTSPAERSDRGK